MRVLGQESVSRAFGVSVRGDSEDRRRKKIGGEMESTISGVALMTFHYDIYEINYCYSLL
jgi:hypothetical protein